MGHGHATILFPPFLHSVRILSKTGMFFQASGIVTTVVYEGSLFLYTMLNHIPIGLAPPDVFVNKVLLENS